jgi:hypothetical protein
MDEMTDLFGSGSLRDDLAESDLAMEVSLDLDPVLSGRAVTLDALDIPESESEMLGALVYREYSLE